MSCGWPSAGTRAGACFAGCRWLWHSRSSRVLVADVLPGFFGYLVGERGLRPATITQYRYQLPGLRRILVRIGVRELGELSPPLISAFVAELAGACLSKATVGLACTMLRVFLRYAHREGAIARDLSRVVDGPQVYRLADIPRSISWEEVGQVLACVDRRTAVGKRELAVCRAADRRV
jgi:integrase/recombinase XerD